MYLRMLLKIQVENQWCYTHVHAHNIIYNTTGSNIQEYPMKVHSTIQHHSNINYNNIESAQYIVICLHIIVLHVGETVYKFRIILCY